MQIIDKKKEIDNLINEATSIFIMGHKYLDLDAIGSAIGIYKYIETGAIFLLSYYLLFFNTVNLLL